MIRAAALLLLAVLKCGAQPGTPLPVEEIMKGAVEKSANTLKVESPAPLPACGAMAGAGREAGREECEAALRAGFRYESTRLAHRSAVFAWQLFSSRLIFGLVTVIVLTGVGLTIWQFRYIFSRRHPGGGDLNSDVEITLERIRVNSSVVGVVVLSLSLAFYFLYLVYVYPVEVIR